MAPEANRKAEKDNAARQKEILCAKEKVLKIKRNILKIVESMLEENISEDWFLTNCVKLCQSDYDDVIQERSIEHLCGYPLCSKPIKQVLKQKYRISRTTNKVYDLTERKCFCSNECYKASNCVKAQLSSIPLYMRKEEHITVKLLSGGDNKGSAGEEIIFHHMLSESEVEKVCIEKAHTEGQASGNLSKILHEEVKKCADTLNGLTIKENVYENPYVFHARKNEQKTKTTLSADKDTSDSSSDYESENSDEGKKLFPDYDNVTVLSPKYMPISETTKKTVLISPVKLNVTSNSPPAKLPLEFTRKVFQDWITEDTLKYLLGEKEVYSVKADLLFQKMMASDPTSSEKLSVIKNEYINLCVKIDKLQDDEIDAVDCAISESLSVFPESEIKSVKSSKINEQSSSAKNNPKQRAKRKSKGKPKTVSFSSTVKDNVSSKSKVEDISKESADVETLPEPQYPLVDSVSQDALRRQVLIRQLKAVFFDILPIVGLHYPNIRNGIINIVETFSLTPTNIIFKPKELKLIALVLLRMLTRTVLKDLYEEENFSKLCKSSSMPVYIIPDEIDELVSDIISPQQIQRLQSCCESENK